MDMDIQAATQSTANTQQVSTLSTSQVATYPISPGSDALWENQLSINELEELLRDLPSELEYTGLHISSSQPVVASSTSGANADYVLQESSQQSASNLSPYSEQQSMQESEQVSTRRSTHESLVFWEAVSDEVSTQPNIRVALPQPLEDMSNIGTACSIGTSVHSWLLSLPDNHLSKSDIDTITEFCCMREVSQTLLQHSL